MAETYIVKEGECLSLIAQRHGVTTKYLVEINNLADANSLAIGQKLLLSNKSESEEAGLDTPSFNKTPAPQVPQTAAAVTNAVAVKLGETTAPQTAQAAASASKPQATQAAQTNQTAAASATQPTKKQNPKYYKIQSGDTLSQIAQKFGVDIKLLQKVNFIKNVNNIQAGKELYIPENLTTEEIKGKIRAKAKALGIDESLALALAEKESTFRPYVSSGTKAVGLFQLTTSAVEQIKGKKTFDIDKNIDYGLRYLQWCLKACKGNVKEALVSYNKGIGKMKEIKATGVDVDSVATEENPAWFARDVFAFQEKYKPKK